MGAAGSVERRSFINLISAAAARFAQAVRGHGGEETRLHGRPGRGLRRGRQPHPQKSGAGDHDLGAPFLHESIRTRGFYPESRQEASQGLVE